MKRLIKNKIEKEKVKNNFKKRQTLKIQDRTDKKPTTFNKKTYIMLSERPSP